MPETLLELTACIVVFLLCFQVLGPLIYGPLAPLPPEEGDP